MERTLALIKPDATARPWHQQMTRKREPEEGEEVPEDAPPVWEIYDEERSRDKREEILARIAKEGFKVVSSKMLHFSKAEAEVFYGEHAGRPFFDTLTTFMSSGPTQALVLEKEEAVGAWRELMGPTNSLKAREASEAEHPLDESFWTLRALYGTDGTRNATHGSDSLFSAWREIGLLFPELAPPVWERSVAVILPHVVAAGRADAVVEALGAADLVVVARVSVGEGQLRNAEEVLLGPSYRRAPGATEALGEAGGCELVLVEGRGAMRTLRLLAGPPLLSSLPTTPAGGAAPISPPPTLRAAFATDDAHPGVLAAPTVPALDALLPFFPPSLPLEATLAVIKPGAADTHYRAVLEDITGAGFQVLAETRRTLTRQEAEEFYGEHAGRPFFPGLCTYMSSGPVVALALCKPGAIRSWRLLCGPTNSAVAARDKPASLRARFGIDGTRNATHGSDSPAAAARELRFYFPTLPLATEGSQVTGAGAVDYIKSTVVAEVYDVAKGHTVTKTVDAVLVDALAELAKAKPSSAPEEAIAWLGQWLLDNNPRRGVVGAGTTKEPTVEEPEEGGSSSGSGTKAHALPPRRPRALARGAPKEGSEGAGTPTPPPPTPPTKRTIVFVLGAPGSGKGTQCATIAARFGFTHLSTGDLLRAEVDSGSAMGAELSAIMARGELVSTALVLQLVGAAMEASGSSKFLLDGYPRALDQAVQFEATLGAPAFVLSFDCPEAVLEGRLLARGVASGRADDANIDVIRARFATYTTHSAPVEAFYGRLGMLRRVNSARALEAVTADTVAHFRPQTAWLLGGPGAGRSTMAERVVGMGLGWNHLSTGELLRAEAASGSELGHVLATAMARGDGAPLGTVVSLVAAAIERIDPVGRFVLDGGVRDMDMAVAFEAAFGTPSFIVSLTAPDAVLLARASGRAHAATAAAAAASTSKAKGGASASASASASGATSPRSDEHSAVHRKQLESFKTLTAPVLDMYATKALVRPVDAGRGEAEVWEDVRAIFSPTCVFMLGGPGSGKGTQCSLAAAEFGYTHLCTSSLLRGEVERGSAVGGVISSHLTSGTLVPTEITLGLIKASIIASRASHILLDGFPRALDQAQAFCASICPPAFVVHLECPEGVAAARLSAAAAAAGGSSEEDSSSSSTSAAALKRARAYTATTLPVLDLFATQGKVRTVDAGEGTPAAVYASLREVFRPTVVYVLGYPGSGKRTQCARTAATYGYTHLCVGDMVRGEVASGSEVGKGLEAALGAGELVPDEVVLGMLHKAMGASGSRRFILNGFPRTARQAQLLEKGDAPGAAGGGEAEAKAEGSGSGSGSAGNGLHRGLGLPAFAVHLEGTKGVVSARLRAPSALARGRVDDTEELIAVRCAGYDKDTLPVVHALDGARLLRTLSALPPPDAVFSRLRRLFTPQVVVLVRDEGCGGAEFCTRVGRELGYATLDVPALLAREAASGSVDGKAIGAALAARRTPPLGPTLGVLERAMAACVSATPRFILDGFPRVISAGFPGVHDQVMAAEERLGAFKGAVVLSAGLDTRIARAGAKAPGEVAVVRAQGDTYRREKLPVAHFFEKLGKVCAIDTSTPLAINPDDLLEAARPYLE